MRRRAADVAPELPAHLRTFHPLAWGWAEYLRERHDWCQANPGFDWLQDIRDRARRHREAIGGDKGLLIARTLDPHRTRPRLHLSAATNSPDSGRGALGSPEADLPPRTRPAARCTHACFHSGRLVSPRVEMVSDVMRSFPLPMMQPEVGLSRPDVGA